MRTAILAISVLLLSLILVSSVGCSGSNIYSGYFYIEPRNEQYIIIINDVDVSAPMDINSATRICNKLNEDVSGHADVPENWKN